MEQVLVVLKRNKEMVNDVIYTLAYVCFSFILKRFSRIKKRNEKTKGKMKTTKSNIHD